MDGQVQIPQVDSQVVAQRAGGREGRAEQPTTRSAEAAAAEAATATL